MLVNRSHVRGLQIPVIIIVLDNAKRIDPQIPYIEGSAESDSLLESLRERVPRDTLVLESLEILSQGFQWLMFTPTVAQTGVLASQAR